MHIPFCARRCGYCNFAIIANRSDLTERFVAAAQAELSRLPAGPLDTVYFGGGTPSQLSDDQLEQLCKAIAARFSVATDCEWTIEANPEDVSRSRIKRWSEMGPNRISLGAQSLSPPKLTALERLHTPQQVTAAVDAAAEFGLQSAVDLIFAAPGETADEWRADVDAIINLIPDHVSTYGLTYERGAPFWSRRERGRLTETDENTQRGMYLDAIERLAAADFEHYEISNFARPERRSRHNQAYWTGDGYYAIGPGAARYVDGVRSTNHASVTTWLRRIENNESPESDREQLDPEQRARERLIFALRMLAGVHAEDFAAATGYAIAELAGDVVDRYVAQNWLEWIEGSLRLTTEGLLISDALWPDLV
ncbi:MAG: radical SAM family heme chaperone HemW [Planctomycetales bacterium]|nr:radical SAM family heme chaperone HemW [Planctomycetales bacterium]